MGEKEKAPIPHGAEGSAVPPNLPVSAAHCALRGAPRML